MEFPRLSRVGNTLSEHGRLALAVSVALPLGVVIAKVLRSQDTAMEAAERAAAQSPAVIIDYGERWQILDESDFHNLVA